MKELISITKTYSDFPFAHRQHKHEGHCSLIHGHNWGFCFEFTCSKDSLDENGFVIDFGDLKWLKDYLTDNFDHTLVLNKSDPALDHFTKVLSPAFASIRLVDNCGAEGLAAHLLNHVNGELWRHVEGRNVRCSAVTVFEDTKNEATVKWIQA